MSPTAARIVFNLKFNLKDINKEPLKSIFKIITVFD